MARLLCVVLFGVFVLAAAAADLQKLTAAVHGKFEPDLIADFTEFAQKFGKQIGDAAELTQKLEAFRNFSVLAQANQQREKGTATHGVTKFADFSTADFHKFFNGHIKQSPPPSSANPSVQPHGFRSKSSRTRRQSQPASLDYRQYGVVTSIKDQGQCGDCYAFASMASLESVYGLWNGISSPAQLTNYSEAEATDCTWSLGNQGCNGGYGSDVYKYVMKSGITNEQDYPFTWNADHTKCHLAANTQRFMTNLGGIIYPQSTEASIATYLWEYGPMYIAIDSSPLQTYQKGILNVPEPAGGWVIDHAVSLIGYGTDSASGMPYWIAKNSWGTDWGEQGFFRFVRGQNCLYLTQNPTTVYLNQ